MNFEWLAALIYPRAIAVHPNFRSDEPITAPALLAAALLQESHFRSPKQEVRADEADEAFANACIAVISEGDDDARHKIEATLNDHDADLGMRAAAGLMVAVFDPLLPARDLLSAVIEESSGLGDSAGRLTHYWLRLATAAIGMQYGEDQATELRDLYANLSDFVIEDDVAFHTSSGLDFSAHAVLQHVLEFLRDAVLSWEVRLEPLGGRLWIESVRRPTSRIGSNLQSQLAGGYEQWTKQEFQRKARKGVRTIGGALLPGDTSMMVAYLVYRFAFHPRAHQAALQLGRARFLRAPFLDGGDTRDWAYESALSLLRFSADKNDLGAVVRYVLRHGPTEALSSDITSLLQTIERRDSVSVEEVNYLYEAVALLTQQEASSLFGRLATEFRHPEQAPRERLVTQSSRRESVGKLLGRLAGPAHLGAEFTSILTEQLGENPTEEEDRILAMAFRASLGINEEDIADLIETMSAGGYPLLRDSVAGQFGETITASIPHAENESAMDKAIRYVNRILLDEAAPSEPEASQHAEVVKAAILKIYDQAVSGGGVSVGGVEPLDVAVGYATVGAQEDLWPLITKVLFEPKVARRTKDAALRRIARWPAKIPPLTRQELKSSLSDLLAAEDRYFEDSANPFPAALTMAVGLELIDTADLISATGPWLSSLEPSDRTNAVSVLDAFPEESMPLWAIQTLLTLTYDTDPDVQTDAAKALVRAYPADESMQYLISNRVNELMARDGSWLIRNVLAELKDPKLDVLRALLSARIEGLTQHKDWQVRQAAHALMETKTN